MSFSRPTLTEILRRVLDDIETTLSGVNARLKRSVEYALGVALAGASHLLHGHISALERMLNWSTAAGTYLFQIASLFGVYRLQPSAARITYRFTGTPTTAIALGTQVTIGSVVFATLSGVEIGGGGTVDAVMEAVEPGTGGNVLAGTSGFLVTPISGVQSNGVVESRDIDARDLETESATRTRFHARLRRPPTGGGPGDYERWARETPTVAVSTAWEYPLFLGGGTVGVIFTKAQDLVADNNTGTSVIPTPEEAAAVQAYLLTKAPTTSYLYTYAPIAQIINPEINLPAGTQSHVRDAIRASLHDLLDPENGQKPGGVAGGTEVTVLISQFRAAISAAPGEVDHDLIFPTSDIESEFGRLPVLGVVSFGVMP